jgi:hypothetical protein
MSCEPTDEVRRIIRAMARAKVEEGFTDANAIVDEIHAAINDHTPLWKNEIADIITGIGQPKRKATQTELQERLNQLKRDLKATYHPKPAAKTPDEKANAAQQTRLRNQIADLQGQINRKDFSKPEKRALAYDTTTQKLQLDLAAAKREADKLMAKIQRANRTPLRKTVDTMAELYRASILSGYTVFEHLAGASVGRLISSPLEQLAGEILHHVPGLRGISERAPTEGGGFQGRALAEGYKAIGAAETRKAMVDKVVRGYSDRQAMYDKHADYDGAFLSVVGHLHDTIKTPVEQFAFYKALTTINGQMRKQLARDGKSPDEIDAELANEYTQSRNGALAYAYSKAAKLQGDNWLADVIQGAIRNISSKGAHGAVAGGLLKLTMPIIRIPTNFAKETAEYATGFANALATAIYHHGEDFTPEINDNIMRNLKKGLVGAALAPLFWILYTEMGALWDEQRKKKAGEPEYGDIRTPLGTINHHLLHIPLVEFGQAVALARRVWEQQNGKLDKKTGQLKSADQAAGDAAIHAAVDVGRTLPFAQASKDFIDGMRDASSLGDYTGRIASGFVPQIVQQIARGNDPDQAPRKPHGFVEQIEQGIPGLRENVAHKPLKGMTLDAKLDLYDKMGASEREKSDIVDSIMTTAGHERGRLTDEQIKRLDAIQ